MTELYIAQTRGYASNCYMLISNGECAVIDPSVEMSAFNLPKSVKVTKVLLTHGHFDHITELDSYLKDDPEVFISDKDAFMLKDPMGNASALFGLPHVISKAHPKAVADGDIIEIGECTVNVIATPGHTEGSVCYVCDNVMFSGDTLFANGIGRCDLIGGNYSKMRSSLKKLSRLSTDYIIYPGHGEITELNKEKKNNYELSRYLAQNI